MPSLGGGGRYGGSDVSGGYGGTTGGSTSDHDSRRVSSRPGSLSYDQAMGAPKIGEVDVERYKNYLRDITTNPNQSYLDELVRTQGKPGSYINPKAPYDYSSPEGLAKFGLGLVGGKLGGLKTFGKTLGYNYARQEALRDAIAKDYNISDEQAQQVMDENKLNLTDVFGGISGGLPGQGMDDGGDGSTGNFLGGLQDMGTMGDMFSGSYGGGAAGTSASYQDAAMKYLMEQDAAQSAMRTGAQKMIGGAYGVPGGEGTQQEMIDRAKASPMYGELMGGREAGEEAILRSAGATGGLRSGNVQENLYDYNTQLQNQALTQAYGQQMQGLQGLAGLSSYAPQIAQGMSGIGSTLAAGQTAQQQMEEARKQQNISNIMGGLKLGTDLYGSGALSGLGGAIGNIGSTIGSWF